MGGALLVTMQNALTDRGEVWEGQSPFPAYKMHNDYLEASLFLNRSTNFTLRSINTNNVV